MFNAEELTSVSEDLDWTLEDCKLGGTIDRQELRGSYLQHPPKLALFAQVCPLPGAQPLALASRCTEASVLQLVTPNQTQDIHHRLTTMATKVLLCCKTNFEQNFYTLLPFQVLCESRFGDMVVTALALEYQKGRKAVRKEEPLCDGQRALQ